MYFSSAIFLLRGLGHSLRPEYMHAGSAQFFLWLSPELGAGNWPATVEGRSPEVALGAALNSFRLRSPSCPRQAPQLPLCRPRLPDSLPSTWGTSLLPVAMPPASRL